MSRIKMSVCSLVIALAVMAPASHAQSAKELETMESFLNIMDGYFNVIESTYQVASSQEKAAIIHMSKIQEVYEQMGQKAKAADVFREVLAKSNNPTIRNAAYMMLADNLKDTGRASEALTLLRQGLEESVKEAQ